MLKLEHEVNVMNAAEPATANPDDDDFFASATQNQQTHVQHHVAYLNDTSTEIHMLQKHPQVRNLVYQI